MKNIRIPRTLDDITLGQYQEFVSDDNISDEKAISILCNIPIATLRQLPGKEVERLTSHVASLIKSVEGDHDLRMTLSLEGREYGMIPNLDEMTYGENKDITTYMAEWRTMHLAMKVLFRPTVLKSKEMYTIEEYDGMRDKRDLMKGMPLSYVLGANGFFYNLTEALLFAIPSYLDKVQRESVSKEQTQQASTKEIGEAMTKSIALLRETLEGLKK